MSTALLIGTGYNIDRAIFLAQASQAAYLADHRDVISWARQQGFDDATPINRANVQGFWAIKGETALLAFRGTQNTAHWLRNARFYPWPHPWGPAHEGFVDGINDIQQELNAFATAASGASHLWITGHSLGGALAILAAAWLKIHAGGRVSHLYTYGQPRVAANQLFGTDFADRFSIELPGSLHRFVNQSDIVTRIPPAPIFRHFGIVKRIVRPGVITSTAGATTLPAPQAGPSPLDPGVEALLRGDALQHTLAEAGITRPILIDSDAPQLTESEFAELQLALGGTPAAPGIGIPTGAQPAGIFPEGNISWIADHAISEYIRLLLEIRNLP